MVLKEDQSDSSSVGNVAKNTLSTIFGFNTTGVSSTSPNAIYTWGLNVSPKCEELHFNANPNNLPAGVSMEVSIPNIPYVLDAMVVEETSDNSPLIVLSNGSTIKLTDSQMSFETFISDSNQIKLLNDGAFLTKTTKATGEIYIGETNQTFPGWQLAIAIVAVFVVIGSVIALICILRRNKVSSEKAEKELDDEIKRAGTLGVKLSGDLSKSPFKNRAALMHKADDLEGQMRER